MSSVVAFARSPVTFVYLPIRDSFLLHWGLVWRTAGETELVRAFVRTAREGRA